MKLGPAGVRFQVDQNQTGSQIGLKNAIVAWSLLVQLMEAMDCPFRTPRCSHRNRVILLNGEKHGAASITLNPAFTDRMMGWLEGWSDPLRPVSGWSHWLRRMRGALSDLP